MTLALFALAAVCAVNAPRARSALPDDEHRVPVALVGAVAVLVILVPVAALADAGLDTVDLSAATARMATGVLLLVTGVLLVGWPFPRPEPALPGRRAAVVPVAFPTLLTPGLVLLTVVGAVDHSAPLALLVSGLALATVPAMAALPVAPTGTGRRVVDGLARALAAGLVVAGLGLLMDGVFDI